MPRVEFIYEAGYYAVAGSAHAMDYSGADFEVSDELAQELSDALDRLAHIEARIERLGVPLNKNATARQERTRRACMDTMPPTCPTPPDPEKPTR